MEQNDLLFTLLKLSNGKEIPYTKRQLEKMSQEKLEQVLRQYKEKELDEFNEAMTDVVISKLDEYMKKYNFIKPDSKLGIKLQNKKLFRNDLKNTISYISPYLPFVGFLEGGITVFSEVVDNYVNKNAISETEKGNQQNQNTEETAENENESENENTTMYD